MCEMKDSGILYIGNIPKYWQTKTVKNFFNITRGRVIAKTDIEFDKIENYYPVYSSQTKNNGCLGYISTYDYDCDSLTWTTDGANAGTIFVRKGRYSITNVCGILIPKDNSIDINYANYAIGYSANNERRADINGYKIMSNEMATIRFVSPDKEMQQSIVRELDVKVTKIDSLIANQEKQIEKLKAYKQSLITEVVTKGLDKNVPMKDSGVEWIGKIPERWGMNRLKFISTYNDESLSENEDSDLMIKYVEIGSVTLENGIFKTEELLFADAPSRARRITHRGDIIVSTVRTYLKAIAPITENGLIVSTGFCVIRPNKQITSKYVEYYAKSNIFTDCVASNSVGISYPAINTTSLMNFYIIEPSLEIQKDITEYLDRQCAVIDALLQIKNKKIEKLNQYKKSLIYEYVTGKKEVY